MAILPLTAQQWTLLAVLAGLILLDAVLAWLKYAAQHKFSWAKFGRFMRKQLYVIGGGVVLAVMHKDAPNGWKSLTSVVWWASAIAVGLQYVFGDILGTKLGLLANSSVANSSVANSSGTASGGTASSNANSVKAEVVPLHETSQHEDGGATK